MIQDIKNIRKHALKRFPPGEPKSDYFIQLLLLENFVRKLFCELNRKINIFKILFIN